MAWNNQGGPWGGGGGDKGGGQSPWSRGPGGGGQPPDFEEMLRRGQDRMKNILPGGMGPGRLGAILVGVAAVLWLASGLYQVQPAERGVPLIFGKFTGDLTDPGLHWNWPAPIGAVLTPNVDAQNTVEIGFRGNAGGGATSNSNIDEESLFLTGDENIIQVEAVVQWFIDDVEKYLFEIRDPNEGLSEDALKHDTVKNAAEAAIREIVGLSPFEVVITGEGREQVGKNAQALAQHILDSYNSGIRIERLSLQRSYAPQDVAEAFRDVVRAGADAQSTVNDANAYKNQVTQQALGQASQIKNQAEGYRAEKIAASQGDAQRFIAVYDQYKNNPDVTSRRLYLETLEGILGNMNKVLVDTGAGGGGTVPYLPLDELLKQRQPQPGAPAPTPVPTVPQAPAVESGASTGNSTATGSTN
jgi:membrane protease subunit HflK